MRAKQELWSSQGWGRVMAAHGEERGLLSEIPVLQGRITLFFKKLYYTIASFVLYLLGRLHFSTKLG